MRSFRLLPATILIATLFLVMKTVEIVRGTGALISSVSAQQQEEKKDEKKEDKKKEEKEEKKEGNKDEDKKEKTDKKEEKTKGEKEKSSEEKPKEEDKKKEDGKEKESDKKPKEENKEEKEGEKEEKNPAVSDTPGATTGRNFSQAEIELLQSLARRRDELARWERNIQVKESALDATEKRIEEKIVQIETMKKAVAELLAQYNTQEDAKLKSLVKIYESMKPDEAARIFNEVEMPVLLLVIDKMAEKKAAPILARMDPKKAKQITVELAEQRRLHSSRLNEAAVPPKPAQ